MSLLGGRAPSVAPLPIQLADRKIAALESAQTVTGDDPKAENTFEQPDVIRTQDFADESIVGEHGTTELPPLSVIAASFEFA